MLRFESGLVDEIELGTYYLTDRDHWFERHCFLGGDPHYVLLTASLGDRVGLFDPYFVSREDFEAENVAACGVELVEDQPRRMNRVVMADTLNRTDIVHYSMGPVDTREAMLIFNSQTRQSEDNAIEYLISKRCAWGRTAPYFLRRPANICDRAVRRLAFCFVC